KADRAAAAISATTWKSRWRKVFAASKQRFECKPWSPVTNAKGPALRRDRDQSPARRATAEGGCVRNRASLRSSDRAPPARERGGSSTIRARRARARAGPAAKRHYPSIFHLASKMALASGLPAKGKLGCEAPRRATYTSSSR